MTWALLDWRLKAEAWHWAWSQLAVIFGWPYGIVVGNLLASFLLWLAAAGIAFAFRDSLAPRAVAFFHRHHLAHLEKIALEVSREAQDRAVDGRDE